MSWRDPDAYWLPNWPLIGLRIAAVALLATLVIFALALLSLLVLPGN